MNQLPENAGRREFVSREFHYTFGPHAPTLRVSPGMALRVVCPDCDNELGDGRKVTPADPRGGASAVFPGNPVAGPIWVEGASAGDAVAVRIERVVPDRVRGLTLLSWGHGLLTPDMLVSSDERAREVIPTHLYEWKIDVESARAELTNPLGTDPVRVSLNPFVGCIGTCPRWGQQVSTLLAGDFGGNMDLRAVAPGATLYLPAHCDGALLCMGDIHAAQGDGEMIGGAIETSGTIDCTIHLVKGANLPTPRLRDAGMLGVIATAGDLRWAIQRGSAELVRWLSRELGMNRFDAYVLVSQSARIQIGGLGPPPNAVLTSVPFEVLPSAIAAKAREAM